MCLKKLKYSFIHLILLFQIFVLLYRTKIPTGDKVGPVTSIRILPIGRIGTERVIYQRGYVVLFVSLFPYLKCLYSLNFTASPCEEEIDKGYLGIYNTVACSTWRLIFDSPENIFVLYDKMEKHIPFSF